MSGIDKSINQIKAALENNNENVFISCVNKLDTSENEYAFTNIHKYVVDDYWDKYLKKFSNVDKDTVRFDNKKDKDKYMDTDIFLYMYPMVVVEEFFGTRQDKDSRSKAYNEFVRRLENGYNLLYNSGFEGRKSQETYFERFVQSIIRNRENSVDLKINLLTYVYGLAQYYQDDPNDGRCLPQETIVKCLIEPVYEEFKSDGEFNRILSGWKDEIKEFRINYLSALANYRSSVVEKLTQTANQTGEQAGKPQKESSEKSAEKKNTDKNDDRAAVSLTEKILPNAFSRCLAIYCIVITIICAALWFTRTSPVNNDQKTQEELVGAEQNSIETSAANRDEKATESQSDHNQSSAVTESESGTNSSVDNSQSQPAEEPGQGESMPTGNENGTPRGEIILGQERNLRAEPNRNDENIILTISDGEKVSILDEPGESWFHVEYIEAAGEGDGGNTYQGYIAYMEGDEVTIY